jgi:hypothetical protein
VAIYTVSFIVILFKTTAKNIHCQECNAKNFPLVQNVNLNPIKKDRTINDEDLTKKIAKTVLEGLSKEQKRHNKKDIMIRIGGAISLITVAILGTFFVNPDDVLLGEIIDMIKSFQ